MNKLKKIVSMTLVLITLFTVSAYAAISTCPSYSDGVHRFAVEYSYYEYKDRVIAGPGYTGVETSTYLVEVTRFVGGLYGPDIITLISVEQH